MDGFQRCLPLPRCIPLMGRNAKTSVDNRKKKKREGSTAVPAILTVSPLPSPSFFVLPVPLFCIFILLLTYSAYLSQVYFKPLSPIP